MIHLAIEDYIKSLQVTQGAQAGNDVTVLPWQKKFLKNAFAPGVSEAGLTMARGGGKTTFLAATGCAFLEADGVVEPASDIVIVASSMDQGQILFDHCQRFLGDKKLRSDYSMRNNTNLLRLINKHTKVRLRVLSSNPAALHGSAPSLILADEVAQWGHNRIDKMLAALRTSLGKIPNSRMVCLGTRPDSPSHPFEIYLKMAEYSQIHAATKHDLKHKPWQLNTWVKANPSLRHDTRHLFKDLFDQYKKEAETAKKIPELYAQFAALRLNAGVPDVIDNVLLTLETWERIAGKAKQVGKPYWGIDLGGTAAASAIAAYYPETGRLETVAAFGNIPDLHDRGTRDGVGSLYIRAKENRELFTIGGRAVPIDELLRIGIERFGRPYSISCDRWRLGELKDACEMIGLRVPIDERGQGYKDGGQDVRIFRRAIAEGVVKVPKGQLFLTAAMSEARVTTDPAGNAKLAKSGEGKRQRARDDAAAAAILAVSSGIRLKSKRRSIQYHGKV